MVRRMMNWPIAPCSARRLQLDVLPRIGVAGCDGRKHILPLRRRDPRPDDVQKCVSEYRYEVKLFKDDLLNLLGEFLALRAVDRAVVLGKFIVERLDAEHVLALEPA